MELGEAVSIRVKALDSEAVVSGILKDGKREVLARKGLNRDLGRLNLSKTVERLDESIDLRQQLTLTLRHRYTLNINSTIISPFIGATPISGSCRACKSRAMSRALEGKAPSGSSRTGGSSKGGRK